MNNVSVIICTLNSEKYLDEVLKSVKKVKPLEIIIVDGNSEDNTVKIAEKHKCKVFLDNRTGLGNARNIGINKANGDYVLFVGPDNLLTEAENYLDVFINEMQENKWSGIGLKSLLGVDVKLNCLEKYFVEGLGLRWINKIQSGECNVIGTPFLFGTKLIRTYKFNTNSKHSDDTDLCDRLRKHYLKVGYSKYTGSLDVWMGIKKSINERFKMYGKSDREYFKAHYKNWKLPRIIKSLLHPLNEFSIIKSVKDIIYIPFVIYIVILRYISYIRG